VAIAATEAETEADAAAIKAAAETTGTAAISAAATAAPVCDGRSVTGPRPTNKDANGNPGELLTRRNAAWRCSKNNTLIELLIERSSRKDCRQHLQRKIENVFGDLLRLCEHWPREKRLLYVSGRDPDDRAQPVLFADRKDDRAQRDHHAAGGQRSDWTKGVKVTMDVSLPGRFLV